VYSCISCVVSSRYMFYNLKGFPSNEFRMQVSLQILISKNAAHEWEEDNKIFSFNFTTFSLSTSVYQIRVYRLFLSTILDQYVVNFNKMIYWWLSEKGVKYNFSKFFILLRKTNFQEKKISYISASHSLDPQAWYANSSML
jgi:hypothetical protein